VLRVALWIVTAAAAALLFLSVWIVLPPPHRAFYPLAVGSPEVAPVLFAAGILLLMLAARHARRRPVARLAVLFAAIACVLSLLPIVQASIALARFNRAIANTTAEPPAKMTGDVRVTRGVPFSKADGVPLSLDVYQPAAAGTYPIIMQIYGGSWQTPEWKWPEQIVDVRTALYWISQDAQKFGGDPTRIVVAGQSAGAQLAMRLAYQEGPSSIRGVVNYYGPVDLAEGWRRPPQPDPLNVRAILEMFIGGTPAQKPEHYTHASPITWVSKASAPTLSIYGSRDHIVEARFGRMLDAALKKAGATSVLLELPWSEHSFDAVPNGMARRIALSYTDRFIAWAVNR
jgi:acetyl esterase/lipase